MSADAKPLLKVSELTTVIDAEHGVVRAVDRLSFEIAAGQAFALLGESGCGKSMTALSVMRLLPEAGRIAAGSVMFDGSDLMRLSEARMREVRGGRLAMIFQEPSTSLNPVLTLGGQIGEVLERHVGLGGAALRARSVELLTAVGIPDPERRLEEFPFQLSGGMKQRVMVAMALAGEPALLIADEPTTALDVTIQAQVLDLLDRLRRERDMAVLLITHDLGVVARMAQRVGVMYAGELVETARRESFFAAPKHPYSHKLFAALPRIEHRGRRLETIAGSVPGLTREFAGCRFAERCPRAFDRCAHEPPGWTRSGLDHAVRCHLYSCEPGATPPRQASDAARTGARESETQVRQLLEVRALAVHFPIRRGVFKRTVGHVKAVDGVSLSLRTGRTLALVGESGCGKTTVGKAILHLMPPTAGSVTVDGNVIGGASWSAAERFRAGIQMVFQDPYASLNPRMRVGDIIAEGMIALGIGSDMQSRTRRTAELLERVGLSADMRGRYPHEFSGGQRQRIAIARALAVNPRILICDEPTSALDVSVQAQILNLLQELQERLELSYLFITHNIAVVEYLAHEVAVMYLGRIVETGRVEEIIANPRHPYTEALLSAVLQIEPATGRAVMVLGGEIPSPANPPRGCHFHPRCPKARPICQVTYPEETRLSATRVVRCHLY